TSVHSLSLHDALPISLIRANVATPAQVRPEPLMSDTPSKPQSDNSPSKGSEGQSLWGGRFSAKPADIMQAINVSIGVDKRLWARSEEHTSELQSRENL